MSEKKKLGRNEPCPICGKKMKNCAGHKKQMSEKNKFPYILGAIVILLIVGLIVVRKIFEQEYNYERTKANFIQVIDEYASAGNSAKWWLQTYKMANFEDQFSKMESEKNKVSGLLQKYRDTNELTQKIYKRFDKLELSIFQNGISQILKRGKVGEDLNLGLEVCFIPKDQIHYNHPNSLYFKQQWNALMIYAFKFPDLFYAAVLYHELGHALYFDEGKPSATAPMFSRLYLDEEVDMTELESEILNVGSGGEYYSTIDALLEEYVSVDDFRELFSKVTVEDLIRIDRSLGLKRTSKEVRSNLGCQHFLALGFRYIDSLNLSEEEKRQRKIDLMSWVLKEIYG
jgi:hypothetical protein